MGRRRTLKTLIKPFFVSSQKKTGKGDGHLAFSCIYTVREQATVTYLPRHTFLKNLRSSVFCRDANKLYLSYELKINQTGRLLRIGAAPAQKNSDAFLCQWGGAFSKTRFKCTLKS
jgi:hypothetical protein